MAAYGPGGGDGDQECHRLPQLSMDQPVPAGMGRDVGAGLASLAEHLPRAASAQWGLNHYACYLVWKNRTPQVSPPPLWLGNRLPARVGVSPRGLPRCAVHQDPLGTGHSRSGESTMEATRWDSGCVQQEACVGGGV